MPTPITGLRSCWWVIRIERGIGVDCPAQTQPLGDLSEPLADWRQEPAQEAAFGTENPPAAIEKMPASSCRLSIESLRSPSPAPSKKARRTQRVMQWCQRVTAGSTKCGCNHNDWRPRSGATCSDLPGLFDGLRNSRSRSRCCQVCAACPHRSHRFHRLSSSFRQWRAGERIPIATERKTTSYIEPSRRDIFRRWVSPRVRTFGNRYGVVTYMCPICSCSTPWSPRKVCQSCCVPYRPCNAICNAS